MLVLVTSRSLRSFYINKVTLTLKDTEEKREGAEDNWLTDLEDDTSPLYLPLVEFSKSLDLLSLEIEGKKKKKEERERRKGRKGEAGVGGHP